MKTGAAAVVARTTLLLLTLTILSVTINTVHAFAGAKNGGEYGGSPQPAFTLSDRFRATCPADVGSIYEFDPSLVDCKDDGGVGEDSFTTWVAVFRSSNNMPSVLVRDEFLDAMRIATTVQENYQRPPSSNDGKIESTDENGVGGDGVKTPKPVAVAKLSLSTESDGGWLLETLRCGLNKENTDDACDGGSEHAEALGVCIDELLIQHLSSPSPRFDGVIRTKATLVSGILLEERGFEEVAELRMDMATHISSLDGSMERYADRVVTAAAKSPGARDRALKILSCLGRLNRVEDKRQGEGDEDNNGDGEDEIDPWAGIKQYI